MEWSGDIDILKDFINGLCKTDITCWSRNGGSNGEPYVGKLGDEIIIRWYPTTKTLQIQGQNADSLKSKLLQCISKDNIDQDLSFVNEPSQNPSTVSSLSHEQSPNVHFNESFETPFSPKQHCCCERLSSDLLDIRNELALLKSVLVNSNEVCKCQDLKLDVERKDKTIKILQDEVNSYKLALEILMKEFGRTNSSIVNDAIDQNSIQSVESENASGHFEVVKRKKRPKKTNSNTAETRNIFKSTDK